jgi:hypothetical protein
MSNKNRIFIYKEKGTYTRELTIVAKDEDEAYEKWHNGGQVILEGRPTLEPSGRPEFIRERPSTPRPPDPPKAPPDRKVGYGAPPPRKPDL